MVKLIIILTSLLPVSQQKHDVLLYTKHITQQTGIHFRVEFVSSESSITRWGGAIVIPLYDAKCETPSIGVEPTQIRNYDRRALSPMVGFAVAERFPVCIHTPPGPED